MNAGSGAIVLLVGLIYLAGIAGVVVAVVLAVRALLHMASALERIAAALEKRPPV